MVSAFIPVRGGSKSIPLKNIKPLGGKPLVCWNIDALVECSGVDEVVVATDSPEIVEVVESRGYSDKVKIYHRSALNATDTASTESVMLEYLNSKECRLLSDDIFILAQATSPLTTSADFSGALTLFSEGEYDSVLSCVRYYRFFWNSDGTSKNYDHFHRPRRQDFDGELMENGALYISKVTNILESGNRLSGKIGIYTMPEYTAVEIDEEDDWLTVEKLITKYL